MSIPVDPHSRNDAANVLGSILARRVKVWAQDGELHYRAPKGALSGEDLRTLKRLHGEILLLLEKSGGRGAPMPKIEPRDRSQPVPLTFNQSIYWRLGELSRRPTLRSVAAVRRVNGALDAGLLRQSIDTIVSRHEALRTRIVTVDGIPQQQILDGCAYEMRAVALSALSRADQLMAVERQIHDLICEPIYVDRSPLLGIGLLRLGDTEHVLIVVMNHIISDGFSMNIFLSELVLAYTRRLHGEALSLPEIPIQFADYAVWQRSAHRIWLRSHEGYWNKRLAGCGRIRLPQPQSVDATTSDEYSVPIHIDGKTRSALREWCRSRQTTMVMATFATFVAVVLRTYSVLDAVIRFQSDCRLSPRTENAIGYFASVLNLRIEARDEVSFDELIAMVTQEYCAAVEHSDLSYLDAQVPAPGYVGNPSFNWIPQVSRATLDSVGARAGLSLHPYEFTFPTDTGLEWSAEPSIVLFDTGDAVRGEVVFSNKLCPLAAMLAFRDEFVTLLGELLRDSRQPALGGMQQSPVKLEP